MEFDYEVKEEVDVSCTEHCPGRVWLWLELRRKAKKFLESARPVNNACKAERSRRSGAKTYQSILKRFTILYLYHQDHLSSLR